VRDKRSAYRVLVRKRGGKSPLGRPKHMWESNNKVDPQEVVWGGMDWITLVQDRESLAGSCECINEPWVSIKCG
jgi:hypothetical protein